MHVARHHHVLKHVPSLAMMECDGLHYHPSNLRPLEMVGIPSPVEPGLHLRVDAALELEVPFGVMFPQLIVLERQCANTILAWLWSRAGEMHRDKVSSFGDFPVG